MPITRVQVSTKIKPVLLKPLLQNSTKLMTDANLKQEAESNFNTLIRAIKSVSDEEAKGTSIRGIIIKDGTTLSIKKTSNIFFLIPPHQESRYERSYLKPIRDSVSKTPFAKRVDVWTLTYVIDDSTPKYVFEVTPSHSKMTQITDVIKWLNSKWTPSNVLVRLANNSKEKEIAQPVIVDGGSSHPVLEEYKDLSRQLKARYPDTLLEDAAKVKPVLIPFQIGIKGLKAASKKVAEVDEISDSDKERVTQSYNNWLQKFKDARDLVASQNGSDEVLKKLAKALQDLHIAIKELEGTAYTADDILARMADYQLIKVNPSYKSIVTNREHQLGKLFIVIGLKLKGLSAAVRHDLLTMLDFEGKVLNDLKAELQSIIAKFDKDADDFASFKALDTDGLESLKRRVSALIKKLQVQARGMIQAISSLNLDLPKAEISEKLALMRSTLAKIKEQIQEQLKVLKRQTMNLVQYENKFMAIHLDPLLNLREKAKKLEACGVELENHADAFKQKLVIWKRIVGEL